MTSGAREGIFLGLPMSRDTSQYPLGTSDAELARLAFQHEVWGGVTNAFLDRIGVREGMRCLDLGCGPGFVSFELAARVGERGSVVALDESPRWIEHVEGEIARRGVRNVRTLRARVQDAPLEAQAFDLVFARWVFSFLPDPAAVARRMRLALGPGGLLAIEDYNHEGISLFPESDGFKAVVRATRALYAQAGGDTWVAARAPRFFREAGLETVSITPNVQAGGPDSGVFRWAGLFFPHFSAAMQEKGLLTQDERARFLEDWAAREKDETALFFSPFVVDALARRA
jgi:SAM-dependent methyltransferase